MSALDALNLYLRGGKRHGSRIQGLKSKPPDPPRHDQFHSISHEANCKLLYCHPSTDTHLLNVRKWQNNNLPVMF